MGSNRQSTKGRPGKKINSSPDRSPADPLVETRDPAGVAGGSPNPSRQEPGTIEIGREFEKKASAGGVSRFSRAIIRRRKDRPRRASRRRFRVVAPRNPAFKSGHQRILRRDGPAVRWQTRLLEGESELVIPSMNVLRFLRSGDSTSWNMIMLMSALSGISGGAILATINVASSMEGADAPESAPKTQLMVVFLLAIALYVHAKRRSVFRATEIVESLVSKLRLRICDKIRKSELLVVENLDPGETFTNVTRDANTIAQSGFIVTNAAQQGVMLIVGMIYLAWLSKAAFVLFAMGGGIGAWLYLARKQSLEDAIHKDIQKQSELFSYLSHLLSGFKETKLNQDKSDELFGDMSDVAVESRQLRLQANMFYVTSSLFADIMLYLLLGAIIFILPQLIPTYSDVLVKATVAVMFVFGPLAAVVGSMPLVTNADTALENIFRLERRLDESLLEQTSATPEELALAADFRTITLNAVNFSYADIPNQDSDADPGDQDAFSVGPIDLQIHRGEILFIVGGNGSGKTTLLKLIAGLYEPQTGSVMIDAITVTRRRRPSYRSLFAGVFSDFHMFDRLYGTGEIDETVAQRLLDQMEISEKVEIVDGHFSTLQLSTGQRKRLALIASLLENRRIYIFDEWTADQDPHFREQFYYSILPDLKRQGKTIIAITHDDRYWGAADRVIKLDYGRIVSA